MWLKADKFLLMVIVTLAVSVFILMLLDVYTFGVDDSFIFFRYAENIANGHGFVFNPGEVPGEGFTSWLWVLLLSFTSYIGLDPVSTSKVLGVFFHVLTGALIYLLVIKIVGKDYLAKITALTLAGGFLCNYRLTAHSVSGMETSLYIFSLVLLVYLTTLALQSPGTDDKWWLILSLCTTGLFLVRPEGIAAGGISLLALVIKRKQDILKPKTWLYTTAGLVVPLGLFITWKTIIFGSLLPLSFYHKVITGGGGFGYSLRHFLLFIKDYWWLLAFVALSMIYSLFIRKHKQGLSFYYTLLVSVMMVTYLFFYPVMNYLHRFYLPYLPLLLIMTWPVMDYAVKKIDHLKNHFFRLILLLLIFSVPVMAMNFNLGSSRKIVKFWAKMVNPEICRAKLGKLMSFLPPALVVANTEMGVIPYYSGLTCIDMAGLTDPVTARKGLTMEYLEKRKVDLILFPRDVKEISPDGWAEYSSGYKNVFLSPQFKSKFKLIGAFAAWPGGKGKYYFYADKTSPQFAAVQQWRQRFAAEPDQ